MPKNPYSELTPYIKQLSEKCCQCSLVQPEFYKQYDVKRGLRELDGTGVLVGLTNISEIRSKEIVDGKAVPAEGELYYRGINVKDIVRGFFNDKRFGFESVAYLLLFGELPNKTELEQFGKQLGMYRNLPHNFVEDVILKAPPADMMNTLARCVLTMYSYDDNPDDTSVANIVRQCMSLMATFPLFSVYGYHAYAYDRGNSSLYIHAPQPELSTAENILYLLRPDTNYTDLEARILDIALVLHAEHGGGNNSTFTNHVVTSSGTDTYSAVAASLGSLKGPRHGGANIKVSKMFADLKATTPCTDSAIRDYVARLLDKKAFDGAGLVYGIGHAVYSLSDPRADILQHYAKKLAVAKGLEDDYEYYEKVARIAPEVIGEKRRMYKGVSANVDFYSGLIYTMLKIPTELYTPLFSVARIAGWSAHRIEELANRGKIIRPGYTAVAPRQEYVPLDER